jgi:hypothetical protein
MWGNLLCLLLLSNRAREVLSPISNAPSRVLDCIASMCTLGTADQLDEMDLPPEFRLNPEAAETEAHCTTPSP